MAPMIDMVFLLLVFFMTVGTMARDLRPPVELAESSTATQAPDSVPIREIITLDQREEDTIHFYFGARPLSEDDLKQIIQNAGRSGGDQEWELRIGEEVPYSITRHWMQVLAEAGITQLHFSVFRQ